ASRGRAARPGQESIDMKRLCERHASSLCLMVAAMLLASGGVRAEEARFSLSVGAEYTTGDYGGEESVDETYVPVTAALELERVSLRLTVPYLSVRAPELTTISGPDGQPIVGEGPRITESGLGDVLASVTVFDVLTAAGGDVAMDLTGKVKFGTADADKGLGTGEQDYLLQADLYRFFERSTLMATAGYAVRGEPDGLELDDTLFASVGLSHAVADGARIGAFFDYREASVTGTDAIQELSVFASTRLGQRGSWRFYALGGFGDSSPDWGGGLSFSTSF
ncbi:MAG: hypothetical protein WBO04_06340, partial [Steroidobacteraceae bacterium]